MSAAFVTIDHSTLLERMYGHFGISGTVFQWFKSYISYRQQRVHIDGSLSRPQDLHFGVPQGSVLGPLLFCLYTTSISQIITNHDVSHHVYADDTQVYIELSQSDTHKSISSLSDCLTDISLWMKLSKLKLNSNKTEFIIIGTKQQRHKLSPHFPVKLLDNDITPSDSVRNLGVICPRFLHMINDFILLRFRARTPEDLSAIEVTFIMLLYTLVPVMNGHPRDQAKVSVHCRWPLIRGN